MDQTNNNLRDATSRLMLGGDTTYGQQSLNDFTKINSQFLNLINGEPSNPSPIKPSQNHTTRTHHISQLPQNATIPPPPTTTSSSQSPSLKRNPEEIVRQLQINHKRRPLIENQKTIETFRNENLELKLQLHRLNKLLEQRSIQVEGASNDDLQRDIVDELLTRNEKLQKQLDERDRRDKSRLKERGCQTNLDSMNIEKLVEASVTLKRQAEEQKHLQANRKHQAIQCTPVQPTPNKQQHSAAEKRPQQQSSVMKQIHYPFVTPQQQPAGSKTPMRPDEKQILEALFTLNGQMTTVFDKLRAISDSQ